MAKLSQKEKYIIQGMLHVKKTSADIAKELNRTEKSVQTYIDGELTKIHETIAKIEMDKNPPPQSPKVVKLPKGQAKRAMAYGAAGGRKGAAVMTPGASAVGDDFLKEIPKKVSRTARGNLYDTEGNKIE